ncbi:LexA family protein [Streptomyces sp. NPDC002514]|uniref:LexA family protein n=1 Tax=Streptomyces sp. NPDC001270 TaxID=3364554 RepID=UPI0036B0EFB9
MVHRMFPLDLVQAQRDWNRTYAALERRPFRTAVLRRQLQRLSVRLASHPYWETAAGRSPAARVELRQHVRDLQEAEGRLTDQQERILACIREWVAARGETPSMREIGRKVGLSSTASVAYQLDRMEQLGVIDRDPGQGRGTGRGIALRW